VKRPRRTHLRLEHLEDRHCPSFTISATGGNLFIAGTPQAGPTSSEQYLVQETSANKFLVQETIGAMTKTYGTFPAGKNIFITLAHYNTNINVDFNGFTFGGNLVMNLGLGDTDLSTTNPVSIYSSVAGGSIRGNVTVLNGSGGEIIAIGKILTSPAAPFALTVGGNVTVAARKADGNPFASNAGDALDVVPGSTIDGNLTTTFVDGVDIGEIAVSGVTPTPLTTVGGNFSLTSLGGPNVGILGGLYFLDGSVGGSATVNMGAGDNSLEFSGTVDGNMLVSAGNGSNDLGGGITGPVGGNLTFAFGNGTNTATIANAPGGTLYWTSGNGSDTLNLGPSFFTAFIDFGTGSNTLALDASGNTALEGTVKASGGTNTFTQNGGNVNNVFFIDFP
jgi:hypothetical protein